MSLGPRLALRQTATLALTPQMQQSLKLLQLSNVELEAALAEAAERNPLLKLGDEEGVAAPKSEEHVAAADALVTGGDAAADAPLEVGDRDRASFDRGGELGSGDGGGGEAFDWERVAAPERTLAEHLSGQLRARLAGPELAIAEALVGALDPAGYLAEPLPELALRLGIPLARAEAVLGHVQACEPTGVGARGLAECLRLQAREADRCDPCMEALLDHLELLAAGRFEQLQRLCRVDGEELAEMIRELRGYDPKPGLQYDSAPAQAVVPDLLVVERRGVLAVELNAATLPAVALDRSYGGHVGGDKAARRWLGSCRSEATWLLRALEQRRTTLLKVAGEAVKRQDAFFRRGVTALKPLTMAELAGVLGIHESTVGRAVAGKWLHCERGTFELRFLFGSGVATEDGEAASANAVKAAIRALIAAERPNAVLSDDALVAFLREQGYEVARRTVAKYREAAGIGSSIERRRAYALNARAA